MVERIFENYRREFDVIAGRYSGRIQKVPWGVVQALLRESIELEEYHLGVCWRHD